MDISTGTILASFVVGTIGFSLFLYGKKQARPPQLITGMVMMVYPYLTPGPLWTLGVAVLLVIGLRLVCRAGY